MTSVRKVLGAFQTQPKRLTLWNRIEKHFGTLTLTTEEAVAPYLTRTLFHMDEQLTGYQSSDPIARVYVYK